MPSSTQRCHGVNMPRDPRAFVRSLTVAARLRICLFGLVSTLLLVGCEPPPLTESGVMAVYGSAGLGPGEFNYPRAISIARDGTVFIVDKSARVQRFSPDGEFQIAWALPQKQAGKPGRYSRPTSTGGCLWPTPTITA
jgi:hypothetical protein